jgi:hypothetical protein
MKERDIDREEQAAQTVLYQKNLSQVMIRLSLYFLVQIFNLCLRASTQKTPSLTSSFFSVKSPTPEEEEQIGRWAAYIRQRSLHVDGLRREFTGWSGNHERHCILHDVFLT